MIRRILGIICVAIVLLIVILTYTVQIPHPEQPIKIELDGDKLPK